MLKTHSWQAVQCCCMLRALCDPGGVIGVWRLGAFFSMISAKPSIHLDFFRFFYYLCLKGGGYQKQRTSEKLSSVFALRLADWLFLSCLA